MQFERKPSAQMLCHNLLFLIEDKQTMLIVCTLLSLRPINV